MLTVPVRALAIDGGAPAVGRSLSPWPYFDEQMCAAAERVLRSGKVNYWTGDEGRSFEKEYAESLGVKHAIALTNGTVALELALYVLGVGPGDEVIVPSRTFIATASCAVMRGARPIVADIDAASQNLTAETVAAVLSPRTKAIIPVHMAGWPCDMDPLIELANERGIHIIEDCAQAHGALYKGRPVGTMGVMGAFSFCQDKILTTAGEGGLLVTNDDDLWRRAWSFKDHGKDWDAVYNRPHTGTFKFLHESFGTNFRLSEVQSAVGRVQLRRLDEWIARRRSNAAILAAGLSDVPGLRIEVPAGGIYHSYYKFYAFLDQASLRPGWTRDRVAQAIQAEGIFCGCGSCGEIYREKAFDAPGLRPVEALPTAHRLHEDSLMFQVHPTLGAAEMHDTVAAARKVLEHALVEGKSQRQRAA